MAEPKKVRIPKRTWSCPSCGSEAQVPTGLWLRACRALAGHQRRDVVRLTGLARTTIASAELENRRANKAHIAYCLGILREHGLTAPPKSAYEAAAQTAA